MPLIKYSTYVYLPGGNPAANLPCPVYLAGGNQLVPLRADKAGMTPLPNPPTTDADGLVEFYAPPGDYTSWLAGAPVLLTVAEDEADECWPGTFIHEQATLSATWTINHYFGIQPQATVLVAGQRAEVDVMHPDANTTVLTLGAPAVGVALLRR